MTEPIRIWAGDTEEQVRSRHEEIEQRLENIGLARVRILMEHGGFPTHWLPIITAWASNDRLEKKKRGND